MDEDKKGAYASSALAGVLVVLSLALLGAVGQYGLVGDLSEISNERSEESSGGDGLSSDSSDQPTADPPSGLSFLCGEYVEAETSATATQLSIEQKNEAEAAAKKFVMAAYGFEGSDAAAHEKGVERQVVGDCFWGSYPGDDTENMNEAVRSGAPRSADSEELIESPYFAKSFVLFDVGYTETVEHTSSGTEYIRTDGSAVWLTEDDEGMYPREQTLTLIKKKDEGEWKVFGGQSMPPDTTGYEQQVEEKIEELEG